MSNKTKCVSLAGSLIMLLVVAACGGGGGSATPPPAPPPPPTFDTPIEITASNSQEVMLEFGVSVDTVYLLTMSVMRWIGGSAANDFEELVESCELLASSGTRTTTLVDNDGNGAPNSGDQFVIEYADDCYDSIADKFLSGKITVDVAHISLGNAHGLRLSGHVTFGPNLALRVRDYERRVSGTVAVEALNASSVHVFEVQIPAGGSVEYSYESHIDGFDISSDGNITSFVAKSVSRYDAGPSLYRVFSYSADVESSLLGGSIHCESSRPISRFDGQPGSGDNIECFGANGSAAVGQIYDSPAGNREFVDTHVDENGDGTYSFVNAIDSFRLWLDRAFRQSVPGYSNFADSLNYELVTQNRVQVDSLDSAHDAANGYLYVLGADELVVLDDNNLDELDRLVLTENYSTMALSESGATLWLAVSDKPELHSYDTAPLQLANVVAYTSPLPSGNIHYVQQLAVVPGSEDHVIALIGARLEIASFRSGSELPATINMISAIPQSFVVSDAQTLYTSTGSRHPQENLIEVAIDPVQGLSTRQQFSGYLGDNSSLGLYFADGELIGNNGRAINTERDTVAGLYESLKVASTGFVAAPTVDRVFAIRNATQINVFRRDSRSLVGTYLLDAHSLSRFRRSHVSSDNLLLTFADMIIGIRLADMPDNNGREACKSDDFSGLLGPGTAFQITCPLESATYDTLRDRLYLGVSPEAGGVGNTIVSVNPNSGLVDATVAVGSKPGESRVSNDGTALYVALPNANELVVVSLPAFQIARRLPLGLQMDHAFSLNVPAFPTAFDVVDLGVDDLAIAMNEGDLVHYFNGVQLPNKVTATRSISDIQVTSDGVKGVAIEPGNSQVVDIDASGVAVRSLHGSLFDGHPAYLTPIMELDDELFMFDGGVFDMQTESLSNPCGRSVPSLSNGIAAPAPSGDAITYYLVNVSEHSLSTCNRASGVSTLLPPPVFFGLQSRDLIGAFHTQNDFLVIVSQQGALILDAQR